jgi:type IV pilus assembly protein PilM
VERAWKKSGTKLKSVALALPSASVITKRILMPAGLTEEEYEVQVETEATHYIPFALDEVNLDFQIFGESPSSPGDVEVLIAASKKEKLEDWVSIIESASLKPVIVDVDSFAVRAVVERVRQTMPHQGEGLVLGVIDIGAHTTQLTVFQDGKSVYEKQQKFGGAQLTQDIARHYGFSVDDAEAKKCKAELPDDYQRILLQPFIESAVVEVTRALQLLFTSTSLNRLDMIQLAGGSAVIDGLAEAVASRTQTDTTILNPFKGMSHGEKIRERTLRADAPSLLTATGLAMRRFNP